MENTQRPQAMYFKDVLKRLKISRTTFYSHYADKIPVTKDASGYRNIYLVKDVEKLEAEIYPLEIVNA